MPTYRLELAYDGSGFRGYASQAGVRTVQDVLEAALATAIGPTDTTVAGRTDAGVHAAGQVVSFRHTEAVDVERVVRSLNGLLPEDVAVLDCREAPDDFDARFSARSRTYQYRVLNRVVRDPLRRHDHWHVPQALDVFAMQQAARSYVGTHDFASFCRRAEGRSTERTVLESRWEEPADAVFVYVVTATAFCHQMVRSLVAVCVEVGRGRLDATEVPQILARRDRNAARGAAPPHGLLLVSVDYERT